MSEHSRFAGTVIRLGAVALCATALLAGCTSGKDGAPGAPGTAGPPGGSGTPGTPGPVLALDISTAQTVKATITGVTAGSQPTIAFTLVDQNGGPLTGLKCAQIHFAIAALVPGANGGSSYWQSYINSVQTAGSGDWNNLPTGQTPSTAQTRQAATEPGFSGSCPGTFKDAGDGTYSYQFAQDLGSYTAAGPNPTDLAIAYQGSLTHRIGLELRGTGPGGSDNGVNNAPYTYVPATGATTGLPASREIVSNQECNACHSKLALHGGPRTDVQYCVTCHNPGTTDAQSGNTLDFKVMVHKIHMGARLPTVVAAGSTDPAFGVGYTIWGYQNFISNFNTVVFPQDPRNCTTCHNTAPDADNYETVVNRASCGACHDNINFDTGAGHVQFAQNPGGINEPDDTKCLSCHGPGSGVVSPISGKSVEVAAAHVIPEKVAGTKFQYNILSVTSPNGQPLADGGQLKITFSVTDPTNGNAPYNLLTASAFAGSDGGGVVCRGGGPARLSIDIAWSTSDYTNFASGALPAQPWALNPLGTVAGCPAEPNATLTGPDGNGVFTLITNKAGGLPAGIGSAGIVFEGHPAVDTQNVGTAAGTQWQRISVTNAVAYAKVNDPSVVQRRTAVAIAKCDRCHNVLSVHGNNRTDNPQACVACHNPGATDAGRRKGITDAGGTVTGFDPVDGLYEQSIDFKYMIHAIHGADFRATQGGTPFRVYGFGGSLNDFSDVGFPGALNNCEGCHVAGAYYPVDGSKVQATTFSTGSTVNAKNPNPPAATSANMALCSACHVTSLAAAHMLQNGGSQTIAKDAFGRTAPGSPIESCGVCHGPGAVADVKVVHQIAAYQ